MNDHPTYLSWHEQREHIAILRARELRLRARIDDLSERVEELREQRDLALHDLWKSRLTEGYWRNFAKRLWKRKSEPESPLFIPSPSTAMPSSDRGKGVAQG